MPLRAQGYERSNDVDWISSGQEVLTRSEYQFFYTLKVWMIKVTYAVALGDHGPLLRTQQNLYNLCMVEKPYYMSKPFSQCFPRNLALKHDLKPVNLRLD